MPYAMVEAADLMESVKGRPLVIGSRGGQGHSPSSVTSRAIA